jgi:hypothetical protein
LRDEASDRHRRGQLRGASQSIDKKILAFLDPNGRAKRIHCVSVSLLFNGAQMSPEMLPQDFDLTSQFQFFHLDSGPLGIYEIIDASFSSCT